MATRLGSGRARLRKYATNSESYNEAETKWQPARHNLCCDSRVGVAPGIVIGAERAGLLVHISGTDVIDDRVLEGCKGQSVGLRQRCVRVVPGCARVLSRHSESEDGLNPSCGGRQCAREGAYALGWCMLVHVFVRT